MVRDRQANVAELLVGGVFHIENKVRGADVQRYTRVRARLPEAKVDGRGGLPGCAGREEEAVGIDGRAEVREEGFREAGVEARELRPSSPSPSP